MLVVVEVFTAMTAMMAASGAVATFGLSVNRRPRPYSPVNTSNTFDITFLEFRVYYDVTEKVDTYSYL